MDNYFCIFFHIYMFLTAKCNGSICNGICKPSFPNQGNIPNLMDPGPHSKWPRKTTVWLRISYVIRPISRMTSLQSLDPGQHMSTEK